MTYKWLHEVKDWKEFTTKELVQELVLIVHYWTEGQAKAPTKQGNDGGLVCPDCLVKHCQHCKCSKCRKQGEERPYSLYGWEKDVVDSLNRLPKKVKEIELPELPKKTLVTEYAREEAVNNLSLSDRVNFADKMNILIDWATAVTNYLKKL